MSLYSLIFDPNGPPYGTGFSIVIIIALFSYFTALFLLEMKKVLIYYFVHSFNNLRFGSPLVLAIFLELPVCIHIYIHAPSIFLYNFIWKIRHISLLQCFECVNANGFAKTCTVYLYDVTIFAMPSFIKHCILAVHIYTVGLQQWCKHFVNVTMQ